MSNVQRSGPQLSLVREETEAGLEAFNRFWLEYPKKVGKPLARAKFLAIINGGIRTRTLDKDSGQFVDIEVNATAEQLVAGAKRYADAQWDRNTCRMRDGGKYVLHPSTWLNQGRWEDGA